MKNKEQKILQDWIDTLQGVSVKGMDIKTRLEARLLRNAWIAENKKIENEIPDQDDAFYQNVREAIAKRKSKKSSKDLWASFFENKLKALLIVILGTGFVYASKKTYDGVVSVADELNHIILAKETGNKIIVNRTNDKGFWDEVNGLIEKYPDLNKDHNSMRCVGYRQVFDAIGKKVDKGELIELIIIATRQLAKRQLTWMRGMDGLKIFDPFDLNKEDVIKETIESFLKS